MPKHSVAPCPRVCALGATTIALNAVFGATTIALNTVFGATTIALNTVIWTTTNVQSLS